MRRLSYLIASAWLTCTLVTPVWADESQLLTLSEQEKPLVHFASRSEPLTYPEHLWLTSVVPGLGQGLMGEPGRGWLFFGGFIAASTLGALLGSAIGPSVLPPPPPSQGPGFDLRLDLRNLAGAVWGILLLGGSVYVYNLIDAYALNQEQLHRWQISDRGLSWSTQF